MAPVDRIEELVARLDTIPDPQSREAAHQLVAAILDLNAAGLRRILELSQQAGAPGQALLRKIAEDSLTGGLLALYGIHPDSMETRVQQTLQKLNTTAHTLHVKDGNVTVKLRSGGPSLKSRLEAAIREVCPDAESVIVQEPGRVAGFVPLTSLTAQRSS
jgi:hypothetical protein